MTSQSPRASSYAGAPSAEALKIQDSQTVTASGTGSPKSAMGEWSVACWQLDVTAAAAASGDTLDVYVQTTLDGTNWIDIVHFTQVLGDGGAKRYISKTSSGAAQAEFSAAASLGAAAVRNLFGNQYRVRWAVAGSGPSFTFSVKANMLS